MVRKLFCKESSAVATALDSLQNNFLTTVAEDCVGDRNQNAHRANLFDLQAKYADVIHSNQILF